MTAIEQPERQRPFSLFWLAYGQVAAMLGAFSLLVFLTHFHDFGLKGVVREAFEVWADYVRQFVGHPIQWLVNLLPIQWRFAVPSIVKDYFAVGLVVLLSFLRAEEVGLGVRARSYISEFRFFASEIRFFTAIALLWPFYLVDLLIKIVSRRDFRMAALWLAPLAYLGLLFAANAWLG